MVDKVLQELPDGFFESHAPKSRAVDAEAVAEVAEDLFELAPQSSMSSAHTGLWSLAS
jgi:hypothetical protein